MATERQPGKLKVFISYSRADEAFADELRLGLEDKDYVVEIDKHSIRQGEEWKTRLGKLIAASDTVVFVLSPDSARSSVCHWEVEEAHAQAKRIIPVLYRGLSEPPKGLQSDGTPWPPGVAEAPARLSLINYPRFDEARSFMAGLRGLAQALEDDLDWIERHSRLATRARDWDEGRRTNNRLMLGTDIADAKRLVETRKSTAPTLLPLQLDFIHASERAETAQKTGRELEAEEKRRLAEEALESSRKAVRRTRQGAAVAVAIAIIAAWQWIVAEQRALLSIDALLTNEIMSAPRHRETIEVATKELTLELKTNLARAGVDEERILRRKIELLKRVAEQYDQSGGSYKWSDRWGLQADISKVYLRVSAISGRLDDFIASLDAADEGAQGACAMSAACEAANPPTPSEKLLGVRLHESIADSDKLRAVWIGELLKHGEDLVSTGQDGQAVTIFLGAQRIGADRRSMNDARAFGYQRRGAAMLMDKRVVNAEAEAEFLKARQLSSDSKATDAGIASAYLSFAESLLTSGYDHQVAAAFDAARDLSINATEFNAKRAAAYFRHGNRELGELRRAARGAQTAFIKARELGFESKTIDEIESKFSTFWSAIPKSD